jgi:F-type H+-transporting ATPase subunit epsilon
MNIVVVNPEGVLYNEEVDSVIVSSSNNGDYEILPNHVSIISTVDTGYVKLVQDKWTYFVVIIKGVVEQHDNQITVIAHDAYIGDTKEEALENLTKIRQERIEENKKRNVELAKAEQELQKQIKLSGAGQV